ncbi:hypothetical protein BC567DRAFT_226645 [Phyllosticta citribraziliensis]
MLGACLAALLGCLPLQLFSDQSVKMSRLVGRLEIRKTIARRRGWIPNHTRWEKALMLTFSGRRHLLQACPIWTRVLLQHQSKLRHHLEHAG